MLKNNLKSVIYSDMFLIGQHSAKQDSFTLCCFIFLSDKSQIVLPKPPVGTSAVSM